MELTKGRNMIEHEREIMARPARTWFQTTVEKAAAKSKFTFTSMVALVPVNRVESMLTVLFVALVAAGLKEHNSNFTEKKVTKRPAPEEKKDVSSFPAFLPASFVFLDSSFSFRLLTSSLGNLFPPLLNLTDLFIILAF